MKKFTDKQTASFMLETRQRGCHYIRRYLKVNAWRLPLVICLLIILLGVGTFAQDWGFYGFLIGLACGVFGRDGVWLRYQRISWPFYAKVINWELVERIAKGEEPTS